MRLITLDETSSDQVGVLLGNGGTAKRENLYCFLFLCKTERESRPDDDHLLLFRDSLVILRENRVKCKLRLRSRKLVYTSFSQMTVSLQTLSLAVFLCMPL